MKNKIFLWSMRVIFLLSLFSVVFCIYQIYYSNSQVDVTLAKWEGKKATRVDESPISGMQFDEQEGESTPIKITAEKVESKKTLYLTSPAKGEVFGKITIPKIKKEFPIIEGTDLEELAKGVGHFIGSVLPGEADNTVLAGHRDTVFRELGSVGIGDLVEVETEAGSFTYKITKQRIVQQDDRTVIVPYNHAVLTLITCYPFDAIGPSTDRFILIGELVEK
ncbi:class D sortase [Neobacillus sp. FSL H8-0543]|uniref:class D sortase n=1 Tax=Neobacillus sp. FSL H8-0543 TaxID=2954672 RepID=UPI003158696A